MSKSAADSAGSVLCEVAIKGILVPKQFLAGGRTGLALLIHYVLPRLPEGVIYFLLNIPLFIVGWLFVRRRFFLYSIAGVFTFQGNYPQDRSGGICRCRGNIGSHGQTHRQSAALVIGLLPRLKLVEQYQNKLENFNDRLEFRNNTLSSCDSSSFRKGGLS